MEATQEPEACCWFTFDFSEFADVAGQRLHFLDHFWAIEGPLVWQEHTDALRRHTLITWHKATFKMV